MKQTIPTFIISLADNATPQFQHAWEAIGMKPQVFSAVDGREGMPKTLNDEVFAPKKAEKLLGRKMESTEFGTFLSHRRLWQHFLDNSWERVLILEEDARPTETFLQAWQQCQKIPPHLMGLTFFFRTTPKRVIKIAPISKISTLYESCSRGSYSTACYMLNRDTAAKLIHHTKTIDCPVDYALERRWLHKIRSYEVRPYLIQNPQQESMMNSARELERKKSNQSFWSFGSKTKRSLIRFVMNGIGHFMTESNQPFKAWLKENSLSS